MERKYTIQKGNKFVLNAPNGGTLQHFPNEWNLGINIIRGICGNIVKEHSQKYFDKTDEIVLIDETGTDHLICPHCGSTDVDVKAWVGEKTGNISYPDEIESEDCYCNKCEKHIEAETSNQNFIIYKNVL